MAESRGEEGWKLKLKGYVEGSEAYGSAFLLGNGPGRLWLLVGSCGTGV